MKNEAGSSLRGGGIIQEEGKASIMSFSQDVQLAQTELAHFGTKLEPNMLLWVFVGCLEFL